MWKYLILLMEKNQIVLSFQDQAPWHLLFYRLKKVQNVSGKPSFLENLRFDWDGSYPKSSELSEFLHALCLTGAVVTTSPLYEEYRLLKGMAALWQQRFEALDDTVKSFLNTGVNIAREEFNKVTSRV